MEQLEFENVMVMNVQVMGNDILVDVYGSDDMIVGTLTYVIDNDERRTQLAKTLTRWSTEDRPLTYLRTPEGIGRLVSDSEVDRDEAGI